MWVLVPPTQGLGRRVVLLLLLHFEYAVYLLSSPSSLQWSQRLHFDSGTYQASADDGEHPINNKKNVLLGNAWSG